MKLIVGLGNPGEEYRNTRHNLGFVAIDHVLEDNASLDKTIWTNNKSLKCDTARVTIEGKEILLARPVTFMNNSGWAVKLVLEKNNIQPEDLVLVHDDVDLPLGKIRVRRGGASAGHRGVQSVIDQVGTDKFVRIRIGIGRPMRIEGEKYSAQRGVEDYVLKEFTSSEKGKVKTVTKDVSRVIKIIAKEGIERYVSKHNK